MKKIGFACKFSEIHPTKGFIGVPELQVSTTTITWLNRQHRNVAVDKLCALMKQNLSATLNLVKKVGELDHSLRMVRIGSDILPAYTHPNWSWFWKQPEIISFCEKEFIKIGDVARAQGVRLSFHPGQFVVLSSENPGIVERSIEEFEYHVDMARWMGFGKTFQDMKINVHISGKRGPEGIKETLKKLSPEARNCITIENDENCWGVDSSIELVDHCALVLDIHHHWIRTGEYIQAKDDRVKRIIDSWRGVRPVCHYSVSREDVLVDHPVDVLPDHSALLAAGYKKQKMRAHSDWYWNQPVTDWALSFWEQFDIMCESKCKNLSSSQVYNRARELKLGELLND